MNLFAPNGKVSNLNPIQHDLVRSEAFISWFGNWLIIAKAKTLSKNIKGIYSRVFDNNVEQSLFECAIQVNLGNKENTIETFGSEIVELALELYPNAKMGDEFKPTVSKVVDSNNEPLIIYHGSYFNFNVFDREKLSPMYDFKSNEWHDTGGFYFSNDFEISSSYKNRRPNKYNNKWNYYKSHFFSHKVKEYFLNLKNPLIIDGQGRNWDRVVPEDDWDYSTDDISYKTFNEGKNDGVIFYNIHDTANSGQVLKLSNSYVAFNSNQIKLADGSNITFDIGDEDVRYENGGAITENENFKKWFDGSKVVNEKGIAMPVYHGTNTEFNVFKSTKFKTAGYFAKDRNFAKKMANLSSKYRGGTPKVYEVYLSIKNPLDLSKIDGYKGITVHELIDLIPFEIDTDFKEKLLNKYKSNNMPLFSYLANSDLTDYIESKGYDGVKFSEGNVDSQNEFLDNEDDKVSDVMSFIAFHPNQIKLADGTNTEFDENNPDMRFEKGGSITDDKKSIFKEWKSLVNMSAGEVKKFMDSEEGKEAGLSKKEADNLGIHYGRDSARWIIKMKSTPVSEWTETMWDWAKRQIAFIKRMTGNKGKLYDDKGNKTRKHTSLLIWGNNPEKYEDGGTIDEELLNDIYKDHHEVWDDSENICDKVNDENSKYYSQKIVDIYKKELLPHFEEEEQKLFPRLINESNSDELDRILNQHIEIRELVGLIDMKNNVSDIKYFCQLMIQHIKAEEKLMGVVAPDPYKEDGVISDTHGNKYSIVYDEEIKKNDFFAYVVDKNWIIERAEEIKGKGKKQKIKLLSGKWKKSYDGDVMILHKVILKEFSKEKITVVTDNSEYYIDVHPDVSFEDAIILVRDVDVNFGYKYFTYKGITHYSEEDTKYGDKAAGTLIYARDTKRYLLILRSDKVVEPNFWGLVAGKVEHGEAFDETALREMQEEIGFNDVELFKSYVYKDGNFEFVNFIGITENEFVPQLNDESYDYKWCTINDFPEPLHFGMIELLKSIDLKEETQFVIKNSKLSVQYEEGGLMSKLVGENPIVEDTPFTWNEEQFIYSDTKYDEKNISEVIYETPLKKMYWGGVNVIAKYQYFIVKDEEYNRWLLLTRVVDENGKVIMDYSEIGEYDFENLGIMLSHRGIGVGKAFVRELIERNQLRPSIGYSTAGYNTIKSAVKEIESDSSIKMQNGGELSAQEAARKLIESLSSEEITAIKDEYSRLTSEQIALTQDEIDGLQNEIKAYEEDMAKEENSSKRYNYYGLIAVVNKKITNKKNVLIAYKNGGDTISFTDKKGENYSGIADFTNIKTDIIAFNEDTILTDSMPPYIPFIDEKTFSSKGYIFDSLRLGNNKYILSVNGFIENEPYIDESIFVVEENENKKKVTFQEQGFVIVTLDQLVLINDYYFTKARATNQKEADDRNKRNEEYYDKLPREKREGFLNQKGYYRSLPAAAKKKITQESYELLSLEEKEEIYKPFKKYGAKRLSSKLDEKHMWSSYHRMYERFINPEAKHPKKGYANPEVWSYWVMFRDFMKWKIKDIKIQRETESEIRKIALETSFGESNTDDALKNEYGILVKRQNGSKINPYETEQIREAWIAVQGKFGNIIHLAKEDNLKISHTGDKFVYASKASGMYVPQMKTIAVSNKYGDEKFKCILAHESAHYIDNRLGVNNSGRWITDDFESTAGKIAQTFRKHMNVMSDSDYTNATKECFARAMEQYFAIETHGYDVVLYDNEVVGIKKYVSSDDYVNANNYDSLVKPLIEKFLEENKDFFKYTVQLNNENKSIESEPKLDEKNEKDYEITQIEELIELLRETLVDSPDDVQTKETLELMEETLVDLKSWKKY